MCAISLLIITTIRQHINLASARFLLESTNCKELILVDQKDVPKKHPKKKRRNFQLLKLNCLYKGWRILSTIKCVFIQKNYFSNSDKTNENLRGKWNTLVRLPNFPSKRSVELPEQLCTRILKVIAKDFSVNSGAADFNDGVLVGETIQKK